MQTLHFTIEIKASREKVWHTLWDDKTFRDWAGIIDEETYMKGELKEGAEVQFISSHGGYGVTSLVERLSPNESVSFRHMADTQESGEHEREKQWTGGTETYSLLESEGVTTLTHTTDVPPELEEMMNDRYPKAMERIKELSEDNSN